MNFSRSEQRVIDLMRLGKRPREISTALGLTLSTINTYQKRAYARVGVHSALELVAKLDAGERLDRATELAKFAEDVAAHMQPDGSSIIPRHVVGPLLDALTRARS
jgi:DNA-binding CsgD family transcriptional regulator